MQKPRMKNWATAMIEICEGVIERIIANYTWYDRYGENGKMGSANYGMGR